MFFEIVNDREKPTEFEIARLRSYEVTSRLNNILFEAFDMGTDIAFMLVLFDQGNAIDLPASWDFYKAGGEFNVCPGDPPGVVDPTMWFNLGVASAFFIALNVVFRLGTSFYTIATKEADITGKDWAWVTLGTVIAVIDPWNGQLIINSVMEKKRMQRDDLVLAVNEFYADLTLAAFETVPQLVIQIIYGVISGKLDALSNAWFVSLFMTLFHLGSQVTEVWTLWSTIRRLKKSDKRTSNALTPNEGN